MLQTYDLLVTLVSRHCAHHNDPLLHFSETNMKRVLQTTDHINCSWIGSFGGIFYIK